jgi:hypothetical protein
MSDAPAPPTLLGLFLGFFSVGMYGFGGVLPWARRMVVEQRRWMAATEFTDILGLCQFLPGGNIMNVTIALGARFHGAAGSVVAFVGLMAAPRGVRHCAWHGVSPVRRVADSAACIRRTRGRRIGNGAGQCVEDRCAVANPPGWHRRRADHVRRDRGAAPAAATSAAGDGGGLHLPASAASTWRRGSAVGDWSAHMTDTGAASVVEPVAA